MLTIEEQHHREEIITLTEQVLDAKGLECDSKISKISEEQLREYLRELEDFGREKRKLKKMLQRITGEKTRLMLFV
ncbi:MAG TPA: hypothetical protein VHF65_09890 [Nitrososphaera sp.]|nr:hypothetical protein [Nitrososphaera sp.]